MIVDDLVHNILNVFISSNDDELSTGANWYSEAYNLAWELSPDNVWRGAGVIAAFSPMCSWGRNKQLAIQMFETGVATGHTKANCLAAQRIYDGENALDVLKGDKVSAFARAIATDGATDTIAVDRHAHDIAMGRRFIEAERVINKDTYRTISEAYQSAARLTEFSGAQLQAITWVTWRNRLNLAYAG